MFSDEFVFTFTENSFGVGFGNTATEKLPVDEIVASPFAKGVVAHPVVVNFNPRFTLKQPLLDCTLMLSFVPADKNLTLIFNPVLPLSITAPVGTLHLYEEIPVTDEAVYVVPFAVPTIGQIVTNPDNVVGAAGVVVETVAVTAVLVVEAQVVEAFLASA